MIPKYWPASVWLVNSFTSLVWVFKTKTATPSRSIVLAFILAKASGVKGLFFLKFEVAAAHLFLVSSLTSFPLCIEDKIYLCSGEIILALNFSIFSWLCLKPSKEYAYFNILYSGINKSR